MSIYGFTSFTFQQWLWGLKILSIDFRCFSIAYRSWKERHTQCFRLSGLIFSSHRAYSSGVDSNQSSSRDTDLENDSTILTHLPWDINQDTSVCFLDYLFLTFKSFSLIRTRSHSCLQVDSLTVAPTVTV